MNRLTIGLLGLTFCSPNLGCGALAYSFRNILVKIARENNIKMNIKIFTNVDSNNYIYESNNYITENIERFSFRKPGSISALYKEISSCDYVFDFTEGDSFTDLYGMKRLILTSLPKFKAIKTSRLILGPQTYGPFALNLSRLLARRIMKGADKLYARDQESSELVRKISGCNSFTTTDVAFALPYEKKRRIDNAVGINISGLLWNGGYTQANQFGLKVDYRKYCEALTDRLIENGYEVHIIPHVIGSDGPDEDYRVSEDFCRRKNNCILSPHFTSPMQAKSYISGMSFFVGARMHATIGAFSSGVITVPFAYSKKFAGLFGTLDYPYVVDGRKLSTEDALAITLDLIEKQNNELHDIQKESLRRAKSELDEFSCSIAELLLK